MDLTECIKYCKGGSRINQRGRGGGGGGGGGGAPPDFFFEQVGGSGIIFLWVGGFEKNSNSCLVGSLSNRKLIN